jgi:parallel beta-helix repeat protein
MTRISLAILALGLGGYLALSPGEASASHVGCGDTITAGTTLDSDLVNCPNNGIVIGADDITLDLNGNAIDGDGTEFAGCANEEVCDAGVANDGHDGVIVRDGSVRGFEIGVRVVGAKENRVLNISSTRHAFAAVVVASSSRSVIRGSSLSDNSTPDGNGIHLGGAHHVRIVRNMIRDNPGRGIRLRDSNKNLIKKNVFSRNRRAIVMEGANRNKVQRNRVREGGGILVSKTGDRNVIVRNRVVGARDSIAIDKGRDNLIADNVVDRARGAGIRIGRTRPPRGGDDNVVRENLVKRSGGDGFLVPKENDSNVLTRNVARRSGQDGFDIESDSTTLTRNRGVRNFDLGIEAVTGVIDGGENRAFGNGDARQCVNVKCG